MQFARQTKRRLSRSMRGAPPPDVFDEPVLSKATIQVSLVMALIVVLGVGGVGGLLKLHGYGREDLFTHVQGVTWNPVAIFVRHQGFHLLWLPVTWTCFAVIAQRRDRGMLYSSTYWAGIAVAVILLIMFFYAAAAPYRMEI